MTIDAYRRQQQANETGREADYRLFLDSTRQLMAALEAPEDFALRRAAVLRTQEVWELFRMAAEHPQSTLTPEYRALIQRTAVEAGQAASLAITDTRYLEALVAANKSVLEGLKG